MLSRKASYDSHVQDSSYFLGWQEYEKNPFHQIRNPSGIIQMGLAENQLSCDLIEAWLESNIDAVNFRKNGESIFREMSLFQDYHGLTAFKNALVNFLTEVRGNKVKFDPNKLVLTAGATAANETLMFCLAEKGDAFLLPTPYYPGFDRDLKWRTEVEVVPIHCASSNGFRITMPALEKSYQQAVGLGFRVKGVLITNPSNPLGTTMTREELNHLISFAIAKKVHIVSDEVYSGTVFDYPDFTSIAQVLTDCNLEKADIWNQVHIVSSLSKDLGLSGFRVGMIYSNNRTVIAAATKMSSFGLVSSQTQYLLSKMLSDKKFNSKYVKENRERLRKRKEMLVSGLRSAGIRCLKSNAGLFCWVDMRHLLGSHTFKAEKELWKEVLYEVGLNISPGFSFHCSEPGWFRICFANLSSEDQLNVALKRIQDFVDTTAAFWYSNKSLRIHQENIFDQSRSFFNHGFPSSHSLIASDAVNQ